MRLFAPLALLLLAILYGCGGNTNPVGTWNSMDPNKEMTLQLMADHTFKITEPISVEGKWTQSGQKVSLVMTVLNGKTMDELKKMAAAKGRQNYPVDTPFELMIGADGDVMGGTFPGSTDEMVFKRAR